MAEFKALQAQINPHFLYNTLDVINWLSQSGQKKVKLPFNWVFIPKTAGYLTLLKQCI